jgi:hypothetical protein
MLSAATLAQSDATQQGWKTPMVRQAKVDDAIGQADEKYSDAAQRSLSGVQRSVLVRSGNGVCRQFAGR